MKMYDTELYEQVRFARHESLSTSSGPIRRVL
jgi:hypothetical protein